MATLCLLSSAAAAAAAAAAAPRYDPTWDSLMTRPLPAWFDEAKVGLFLHWGIFSVPSYRSEWYWWSLDGSKDPDYIAFHNPRTGPTSSTPRRLVVVVGHSTV